MSAGKGDRPRHQMKAYGANFDAIFRKKTDTKKRPRATIKRKGKGTS